MFTGTCQEGECMKPCYQGREQLYSDASIVGGAAKGRLC